LRYLIVQIEPGATSTVPRDGTDAMPGVLRATDDMNGAASSSLQGTKRRKNPFAPNRPRSSLPDTRSTSNPADAPQRRVVFLSPKRRNPHTPPASTPSQSQPQSTLTVSRERSQLSVIQARARHMSFSQAPRIQPISRPVSPMQSDSNLRTNARTRVPSLTQPSVNVPTSNTAHAPSTSITRPRQSGSTGVPPKDALKYTRKRN
jgi:hypothetical protein